MALVTFLAAFMKPYLRHMLNTAIYTANLHFLIPRQHNITHFCIIGVQYLVVRPKYTNIPQAFSGKPFNKVYKFKSVHNPKNFIGITYMYKFQ